MSLDLKVLYKFIWKKKSHSFQVIVWLLLLPQVRENLEKNSEQKNVIEAKWERLGLVGGGSGQSKCCGQRGSSCYGDSSRDNKKELQWQDSTCLELQSETIELA